MSEQRIFELEQQLVIANSAVLTANAAVLTANGAVVIANEAVAKFTLENTALTEQLVESEKRFKKLKRNSKTDESSFRSQLATAQNRRS